MSWPSLTSNSRRMAYRWKTPNCKTCELWSQSLCSSKLTSAVVLSPISQPRKIQMHRCLPRSSVKRMGYPIQLLNLYVLESSNTSMHTMEEAPRASHGRYIHSLCPLAKNNLNSSIIKVKRHIPLRKQVYFWIKPSVILVPAKLVIKIILRETRRKEEINLKHNRLNCTVLPEVQIGNLWQVSTRIKPPHSIIWSRPLSKSILTPLWLAGLSQQHRPHKPFHSSPQLCKTRWS